MLVEKDGSWKCRSWRNQVLDLVVEEVVVPHCRGRRGGTTTRRHRYRTSAAASATSPPARDREHPAPPQEEEQRVTPMHRVGEMPDGLDIEVGLHHSASRLEDLRLATKSVLSVTTMPGPSSATVAVEAFSRSPVSSTRLASTRLPATSSTFCTVKSRKPLT